jgi:hypothetical protein
MSVVPKSQLSLMRKRKEFTNLMETGQWEKLIDSESELFAEVDLAVSDKDRSSKELLKELGSVVKTYKELSKHCALFGKNIGNDGNRPLL